MSIVRIFKNEIAFPKTWFVQLENGNVAKTTLVKQVCAMYDEQDHLLGYNLFDIPSSEASDGYMEMSESLLETVNQRLAQAGFPLLQHDFSAKLVVGHVVSMEEHPDSDHLHVCMVDVGQGEPIQIVCGAHNVDEDAYVVVALKDAVMPDGKRIIPGKLRGVMSHGMLCSAWELKLIDKKQKGLLLLDDTYLVGAPFFAERMKHHV